MPCAGPDYSCNSLINLRSPLGEVRLGEVRLGEANSSALDHPRPSLFARLYYRIREAFARRRQRRALAHDARLLTDIGLAQSDVVREVRKPIWK
jgi:uncharacterized protein YjiS (DUF1127 family)